MDNFKCIKNLNRDDLAELLCEIDSRDGSSNLATQKKWINEEVDKEMNKIEFSYEF